MLFDADQEAADQGKARVVKIMEGAVKKGRMSEKAAQDAAGRITAAVDYEILDGADLIIEAVFENRELKADVTARAEARLSDDAVFASNTSTLPITGLAEASSRPDKFIGIHFFSPVEKMQLVEIIMGEKTSDETLAKALDYVKAIRKTPIVVNDSRGFFTSRVVSTYLAEGHHMLSEGIPRGHDRECGPHGRHAGRARWRSTTRSRSISPGRSARRPRPIWATPTRRTGWTGSSTSSWSSASASGARTARASTTIRRTGPSACGRDLAEIVR